MVNLWELLNSSKDGKYQDLVKRMEDARIRMNEFSADAEEGKWVFNFFSCDELTPVVQITITKWGTVIVDTVDEQNGIRVKKQITFSM